MRRLLPITLAAMLLCCASAQATFTPFALVSADPSRNLEADFAYDPAISADGRYVVFTGSVASHQGVYRRDLQSGTLELVATGTDTGAPSISANGQYVSFTTTQNPETGAPGGTGGCSSVFVRNMNIPPRQEPPAAVPKNTEPWQPEKRLEELKLKPGEHDFEHEAFTLVSAANGSPAGLVYAPEATRACGSATAARVALSADGQKVAFTVLSPSNLTGACESEEETLICPTPPYQVLVRDLADETTTLVSSTLASRSGAAQPVPKGAALAGPTGTGFTSLSGGGSAELAVAGSTAAISADGGTVAWMGIEIAEQAPVAQSPPRVKAGPSYYPDSYAEPLWRRIAQGPTAPTRRVLVGDDPSAPQCPPACPGGLDMGWDTQGISGSEYTGAAPQFGSYTARASAAHGFAEGAGMADPLAAITPQLSANGIEVALLSTQPNYGEDPNFGTYSSTLPPPANAFVVNMAPGLTRAQAIVRLTDWASLNFNDTELAAPVTSIALSGDGSRVAFTTDRIAFPLAPPALITPTLSQAGVAQLYEANLLGGTLALVSFGYDGQPANEAVYAAGLSEDGRTIALSSGATNLSYGVVNQGSDIFTTEEIHSPAAPGRQSVSPTPPWPAAEVPWSISATATPSPDGTLVLYVSVPGAGRLSASALSAVSSAGKATKRRTAKRGRGGGGRASTRGSAGRGGARSAMAARRKDRGRRRTRKPAASVGAQIAYTAAYAGGPEVIELHLIPAARYDSLLRASRYGLYSTITVTFTAPGHSTLHETLRVSFPHRPPIYDLPRPGYPLPKSRPPKHPASRPRHGKHRRTRGRGHG